MNQRIRELAELAGLQPFEDCGPGYVHKMEKFAELIVQECIDIHVDDYGADIIGDVLKEHFGVKE